MRKPGARFSEIAHGRRIWRETFFIIYESEQSITIAMRRKGETGGESLKETGGREKDDADGDGAATALRFSFSRRASVASVFMSTESVRLDTVHLVAMLKERAE